VNGTWTPADGDTIAGMPMPGSRRFCSCCVGFAPLVFMPRR
jgi:hypothetical protein